ncbi:hypothetical protein FACS1894179_03280 [Bacteroidia bacterium]|nr:hypothetical protein FACS1894179_03280 [Bacteroidia bacterium]
MKRIIFICICFGVLSCQKNVYFNEIEKSFLETYNIGDTLIFESGKGEKDTVAILDKNLGYAQWNPLAHSGEYKTLSGETYYGSDKKLYMNEPYPYTLLSISKSHPDTSFFYINIRGASILKRFSTSTYNAFDKFKINDSTYLFQSQKTKENKVSTEYVYWNINYGITQYIGSDSIVWKRINTPK